MAKKQQNDEVVVVEEARVEDARVEEARVEKAEAVAKAVDAQVEEDARKAEADAIQAAKDTELLEDQVYEEEQHDNPFEFVLRAQILEVRKNKFEVLYVKFQPFQKERLDVKEPIGYVPEDEFRTKFPILVK